MNKKRQLVSIVIPVYNEQENISWFFDHISKKLAKVDFAWELIYVDDGSRDNSYEELRKLQKKNSNVRVIKFSRNFGKEIATSAGLHACGGDAAVMIDADGQHPIELLPEMVERWRNGSDIVIGVRTTNKNEGLIKKYGSVLFYGFTNSVLKLNATRGSTDFRLVSRKVLNSFKDFGEHSRMTRGIIDWMGFKRELIEFEASERAYGKASYNYYKLVRLALDGIISHSTKPLQLSGFLGVFVMLIASVSGVLLLINLLLGDPYELNVTGSAILGIFLSFMIGLVLFCQGLLSLYIENIYREAQGRPLYVIEEQL